MNSDLLFWDEQGLVAALMTDLCAAPSTTAGRLLNGLEAGDETFPLDTFTPSKLWAVVHPDLGSGGFGRPGALALVQSAGGKKALLMIEAAGTTYSNASKAPSLRGTRGFSRSLNGRIENNYSLAVALAQLRKNDKILVEPQWITGTPYNRDRRDVLRAVTDRRIVEEILKPLAGQKLEACYHLVITTDETNPFTVNYNLPEFYDAEGRDQWPELAATTCWISFDGLAAILGERAGASYGVSLAANRSSMDFRPSGPVIVAAPPEKGVALAYIPDVQSDALIHLTWQKDMVTLRHFNDPEIKPKPMPKFAAAEIREALRLEIIPDATAPVGETEFWFNYIRDRELSGIRTVGARLAMLAGLVFDSQTRITLDPALPCDNLSILAAAGMPLNEALVAEHAPRKLNKKDIPVLAPAELQYPEGISVFDLIGSYDPGSGDIVIYTNMCRLAAAALNLDAAVIEKVVLAHMAAHAVVHKGRDGGKGTWTWYREAPSRDRELFAQVYPAFYFRNSGDTAAEETLRALTKLQSPVYNAWTEYLYMSMEKVNQALAAARRAAPPRFEMMIHRYDGINPVCPVDIITDDGRIFRARHEGLEWRQLGVTSFHMEPYVISREVMAELKDFIVSNDLIYVPGGLLKSRIVTEGVRESYTFRIKVNDMENEWIGAGRFWGEYEPLFRRVLRLFDRAISEARG